MEESISESFCRNPRNDGSIHPAVGGTDSHGKADGFMRFIPRGTVSPNRLAHRVCFRPPEEGANPSFDAVAAEPRARSITSSLVEILCSSWLNALLVFVPIGIASHVAGMSSSVIFACNAVAIVPLSALLTSATERIATHFGDTIGALLNMSLGNLVELILIIAALSHGHLRLVEASVLGSVLVNLLFSLGSALLIGSTVNSEPAYSMTRAQLLACLLFVSVFAFLLPTAFEFTLHGDGPASSATLQFSRISSLVVFSIYILYLIHEIRMRSCGREEGYASSETGLESHDYATGHHLSSSLAHPIHARKPRHWATQVSQLADDGPAMQLAYSPVLGDKSEHKHYGTPDSRGRPRSNSSNAPLRANSRQPLLQSQKHSVSYGGRDSRDFSTSREMSEGLSRSSSTTMTLMRESEDEAGQNPCREFTVPIFVLISTSVVMSICAELLVGAIDDVTRQTRLSESFIGIIVLPMVGNVAEYVTVVTVAARDKLDLAIAVSVGSCVQIALCVKPLTIIAGWILQRNLVMTFSVFEMAALLGSVLVVNLLVLSGTGSVVRSGGLKGVLMCACYVIMGLGAYFTPESIV